MAGFDTLPMVWSLSTSGRTEHHGHPQSNSRQESSAPRRGLEGVGRSSSTFAAEVARLRAGRCPDHRAVIGRRSSQASSPADSWTGSNGRSVSSRWTESSKWLPCHPSPVRVRSAASASAWRVGPVRTAVVREPRRCAAELATARTRQVDVVTRARERPGQPPELGLTRTKLAAVVLGPQGVGLRGCARHLADLGRCPDARVRAAGS